jgi:hypothetical protein
VSEATIRPLGHVRLSDVYCINITTVRVRNVNELTSSVRPRKDRFESDTVTNGNPEIFATFVGNPVGDGDSGYATRLRDYNIGVSALTRRYVVVQDELANL